MSRYYLEVGIYYLPCLDDRQLLRGLDCSYGKTTCPLVSFRWPPLVVLPHGSYLGKYFLASFVCSEWL